MTGLGRKEAVHMFDFHLCQPILLQLVEKLLDVAGLEFWRPSSVVIAVSPACTFLHAAGKVFGVEFSIRLAIPCLVVT